MFPTYNSRLTGHNADRVPGLSQLTSAFLDVQIITAKLSQGRIRRHFTVEAARGVDRFPVLIIVCVETESGRGLCVDLENGGDVIGCFPDKWALEGRVKYFIIQEWGGG